MSEGSDGSGTTVFDSKRVATRYQVMVEVAERQPAVSQREIAEAIGVTTQAVSDYLQGLVGDGFVEKHGRGRYEATQEGVDWLITRTDELHEYVRHVSEDVVGDVEIETAIATAGVAAGDLVSLTMRDGVLRATPGADSGTTAVAVTAAERGDDVGVTDVEGVLDYELGEVTVFPVPGVDDGGSSTVATDALADGLDDVLVVASGVEAFVAVESAGMTPDVRYGTEAAVREAATRGVDVGLVVVEDGLQAHTERLQDLNIAYTVVEPT